MFPGYYDLKKGNFLQIQIAKEKKKIKLAFQLATWAESRMNDGIVDLPLKVKLPLCFLGVLVSTKVMLCCWESVLAHDAQMCGSPHQFLPLT